MDPDLSKDKGHTPGPWNLDAAHDRLAALCEVAK